MSYFAIPIPSCKGGLSDAQEKRRAEARESWCEDVLGGSGDVSKAVTRHQARYGRAYPISAFHDTGRGRTLSAWRLLGGTKRQSHDDAAGSLGRLVVLVGSLPLQSSVVKFSRIPELAHLAYDPVAQWDKQTRRQVKRWIERSVTGPYFGVVERGIDGENHVHVIHAPGACTVGRRSAIDTPEALFRTARYLSKKAPFERSNVVGYVQAVRAQGSAASRVITGRLGSHTVTIKDVENLLGFRLIKPVKGEERANHDVGHWGLVPTMIGEPVAPLPRMRLVSTKPVFAGGVFEPILTREQALDAVIETLPKASVMPCAESEPYLWPTSGLEAHGSIWEPSQTYPGMSPPFLVEIAYQHIGA